MKKVDVQHAANADHQYANVLKELWTLIVYPIIAHLEIKACMQLHGLGT
jgi:hypothetical protein